MGGDSEISLTAGIEYKSSRQNGIEERNTHTHTHTEQYTKSEEAKGRGKEKIEIGREVGKGKEKCFTVVYIICFRLKEFTTEKASQTFEGRAVVVVRPKSYLRLQVATGESA